MTDVIDPAVVGLWRRAIDLGWRWEFTRGATGTWQGSSTGNAAGVCYRPPDDVCNGWLECHDDDRTLTLTGILSHGEAATRAREFFGWPAHDALPEPSTGPGVLSVPTVTVRGPARGLAR